jgi:two-component system, NtrC family, nitrogen regulation response regulator GlnG
MSRSGIADVSTAGGSDGSVELLGPVPALTIVAHPVARRVGERALLHAVAAGREVLLSRNAPDFTRPGHSLGVPLDDPFVSRAPIRFAPGPTGGIRLLVEPSGTQVVAGVPIEGAADFSAEEIRGGVPIELARRVVLLLHHADPDAGAADALGMVGDSAGIRRVRRAIERIVDLEVPVLVRGETGTGKELVARAIHDRGPRRAGPFVSVNLGAIPRELASAELFGSVKGAYTGASRDRDGFFRAAHGGTLFLDEVGEAPPEVQVMLLRVLETGEMYPVGADKPVATQVRLIAATDADLEERIRAGRFKAPLLHRLAGYEIRLPPLRERREDIGPLFHHFARAELEAIGETSRLAPQDPYAPPWLPAPIAARLVRHAWPGNVRQLRNAARQLVIGSRGLAQVQLDSRLLEELSEPAPAPVEATPPAETARSQPGGPPRRKASEVSEEELVAALRESAWDLKAAADRLRIPRPSIYDLIDRSQTIRTAGDLDADEIARSFRDCRGDLDAMVAQLQVSRRALSRRIKELRLDRDD